LLPVVLLFRSLRSVVDLLILRCSCCYVDGRCSITFVVGLFALLLLLRLMLILVRCHALFDSDSLLICWFGCVTFVRSVWLFVFVRVVDYFVYRYVRSCVVPFYPATLGVRSLRPLTLHVTYR